MDLGLKRKNRIWGCSGFLFGGSLNTVISSVLFAKVRR